MRQYPHKCEDLSLLPGIRVKIECTSTCLRDKCILEPGGQPQIPVGYSVWYMAPKERYPKLISVFYTRKNTCGPVMHEHVCTHTHLHIYTDKIQIKVGTTMSLCFFVTYRPQTYYVAPTDLKL